MDAGRIPGAAGAQPPQPLRDNIAPKGAREAGETESTNTDAVHLSKGRGVSLMRDIQEIREAQLPELILEHGAQQPFLP